MELESRLKSVLRLVPIVVIMCLHPLSRITLVGALGTICMGEYASMTLTPSDGNAEANPSLFILVMYQYLGLAGPLGWLAAGLHGIVGALTLTLFILVLDALLAAVRIRKVPEDGVTYQLQAIVRSLSAAIFGLLWICLPLSVPLMLQGSQMTCSNSASGKSQGGMWTILFSIFVTVAGENGGLFGGSLIRFLRQRVAFGPLGKRFLTNLCESPFPILSPNKTFGGYMFQILTSALCAMLIPSWFGCGQELSSATTCLSLGGLFGILGSAGDLFESLVKRSNARKTTGNILPGWGGLLDRLDGLLFVFPITIITIVGVFGTHMTLTFST